MSKRYSSWDQERHFEPRRIQILKRHHHKHSRGGGWYVVIRNMLTDDVEEWYSKPWGKPAGWHKARPFNALEKGSALDYAKQQARELELAFDLTADVDVDFDEVVEGPKQRCLLCERDLGRGRDPGVCQQCRAFAAAGKEAASERKLYRVVPDNLMPKSGYIPDSDHYQRRMAFALLPVAGVMVEGSRSRFGEEKPPCLGSTRRSSLGTHTAYDVHLTESQFKGMQDLVQAVLEYGRAQRLKGQDIGSSLLRKLAEGEMHPDAFSDARRNT